jgi:hypothetical protein
MNLLPKAAEEFRNREYWDKFFDKVGAEAFEWSVEQTYRLIRLFSYIHIVTYKFRLGIQILPI